MGMSKRHVAHFNEESKFGNAHKRKQIPDLVVMLRRLWPSARTVWRSPRTMGVESPENPPA